jgi:hypothetical protein
VIWLVSEMLNPGRMAVRTYEVGGDDLNRRVAESKFAKWPKFAKYKIGHVALQGDHGDPCFANIKLRPLPAKP